MVNRKVVFNAINNERNYQDKKWGNIKKHTHTVPEWLLIMEGKLEEAKKEWLKNGDYEARLEILKVIAVGTACLEQQNGIVER